MAAPSIGSGIEQLDLSDDAGWTAATVGGSDGAYDNVSWLGNAGADPTETAMGAEHNDTSPTSGNRYSAYSASWTAFDMSAADSALLIHFAHTNLYVSVTYASNAIRIFAFNASRSNYAYWDLGGPSDPIWSYPWQYKPVLLRDAEKTGTGGTWDNTDVVEIGFGIRLDGQYGNSFLISQIVGIDGQVVFQDGDGTTAGSFAEYYDLLKNESGEDEHNYANIAVPPAYGFGHAVRINSTNFSDSNFSFLFLPSDFGIAGYDVPTTGFYSLSIDPSVATATLDFTDGSFSYSSGTYVLDIDGSTLTSGTLEFTRVTFLNASDVTIDGSQTTLDTCSFEAPESLTIGAVDTTSMRVNACDEPVIIDSQLVTGSSITITSPVGDALQFDMNPVNDAGRTYTVPSGAIVNFNPTTTGTYTLTGLESSGAIELDNLSSNDITVTLDSGLSASLKSPQTGSGTITIDNSVTVSVKVTAQTLAGVDIQSAQVYLEADTGGSLPAAASVTMTRSGSTVTVTHTAHGLSTSDQMTFYGSNQDEYNGIKTITVTTANAYTFTVSGTPTTPATGTITGSFVILNGATDSNGEEEDASFPLSGTQPVTGVAVKSTATPLYKPSPISGSITTAGFDYTVFLTLDE